MPVNDVRAYPYGLPPREARRLSDCVTQIVRTGFRPVTDREMQVLAYAYLAGHSTEEVGQALCLSPLTVKTHLQNVRKALGLNVHASTRVHGPIVYAMGYLSGATDALRHQQAQASDELVLPI